MLCLSKHAWGREREYLEKFYYVTYNIKVIVELILGICTGILATHKGYHFLAWFFAGGLIGIIILACLPDTVEVKTLMEPEEVSCLRKRGNAIGMSVSLLVIIINVLLVLSHVKHD